MTRAMASLSTPHLMYTLMMLSVSKSTAFVTNNCILSRHALSPRYGKPSSTEWSAAVPSWSDLGKMTEPANCNDAQRPMSIDSALDPTEPSFSTQHPTLFRERHGWCPYSERVWLTMELLLDDSTNNFDTYDTVRIDNTGHGPRPSYYDGQTPQINWPDGRRQGESMDLVFELDRLHGNRLNSDSNVVKDCINQFRNIFPKARPSSRAAFLFQWNGEPLSRSTFEQTLQDTNNLLGNSPSPGPFFTGSDTVSAADIAWAPFLERYRYQLPCLHPGLDPSNAQDYPHLAAWYQAMDQVPAYACCVKGDASSWRKVLTMAGFGNAGLPPQVEENMKELCKREKVYAKSTIAVDLWKEYASSRPYLAHTPGSEAAWVMTQNREAIVKDVLKRAGTSPGENTGLPTSASDLDDAMRAMVHCLIHSDSGDTQATSDAKNVPGVGALALFLDERMCVPRDMGSMPAASVKHLAWEIPSN